MAKKRKAHSRRARDQRLYNNIRAWMWEAEPADDGNEFVLHVDKKAFTFGWSSLTDPRMIENLFAVNRNWVICGRALVRSADGTEWMEQADMTLPSCKLLGVQGAYDELRSAVLGANQERHVYDCGWIAQTWLGNDPSEHDSSWVYHDAPPYMTPKHVPSGMGYDGNRHEWWQMVNDREKERHE